jgi:hypothetical protein
MWLSDPNADIGHDRKFVLRSHRHKAVLSPVALMLRITGYRKANSEAARLLPDRRYCGCYVPPFSNAINWPSNSDVLAATHGPRLRLFNRSYAHAEQSSSTNDALL